MAVYEMENGFALLKQKKKFLKKKKKKKVLALFTKLLTSF